ncbi:MAG: polysaccharide deacetylase family protein [Clostridium sp.]
MKQRVETLALLIIVDMIIIFLCLTVWHQWNTDAARSSAVAEETKILALTFDDGPHPKYTKKLLEGLKKRNVKATFFLVGENITGNETLVEQMAEDGHLIGTHCYSHEDLTKKSAEEACKDILKTNQMIEAITGHRPEYIRPPYGIWSAELEDCVDMTTVLWDIDTLDWKRQNRDAIVRHIEKNVGKHRIILMHDVFEPSVDAAFTAIDTLTKQGYTFVTIDELMID